MGLKDTLFKLDTGWYHLALQLVKMRPVIWITWLLLTPHGSSFLKVIDTHLDRLAVPDSPPGSIKLTHILWTRPLRAWSR